ncbi:MAG: glutathione S-transferase family protein [Gammaproteobacteria bacterium]|nr:glutathione S-transferase family protein [Gammaproteobacteria bacterium]
MPDIKLYSYGGCPFARRTRMTLAEKDIDYELIEIDLRNRPANFKEISPYGKVPVLFHNGNRLYESAIINEYLDEVYPEPPLMPDDPLQKAQTRIWMNYCDTQFSNASWQFMQAGDNEEKLAAARATLRECFLFIEHEGMRQLSDGPYWLGDTFSMLDIQFATFFSRYMSEPGASEIPTECTRLKTWLNLMAGHDSFLKSAA